MPEKIYLQIEEKDLRMLLSLATQNLSFASGKGTHECQRTIERITDYLNNFVDRIKEHPLMLLMPVELPLDYEFVGSSKKDGVFQLHLKRRE